MVGKFVVGLTFLSLNRSHCLCPFGIGYSYKDREVSFRRNLDERIRRIYAFLILRDNGICFILSHIMKHRSYYLDNLCCILILHMIYTGHIAYSCGGYYPIVITFIQTNLSFFMSWFFFKGGMMHKICSNKVILKKSYKRLLIPFFCFLVIGFILNAFISHKYPFSFSFLKEQAKFFFTHSILWPTAASWFLLSLFVVRLAFNVLCPRIHPILITIIFTLLGNCVYYMQSNDISFVMQWATHHLRLYIPFYIGTMFHGLAVFSLGYYTKEIQFDRRIFILTFLIFVIHYIVPADFDFRANNSGDSNYLLAVLYGMAGCVVFNNIFKRFCNYNVPLLTHIGANSMVYYLVHYPVMYITISLFWTPFSDYALWKRFCILSSIVTISLLIAEWVFRHKKIRFIVGG